MTVSSWTLLSTATGSIVIDVYRSSYSSFPATQSISGSEKPTLTSQIKNQNSSITTWSTINVGDTLRFNVDSVSNVTKVTLIINGISNGL